MDNVGIFAIDYRTFIQLIQPFFNHKTSGTIRDRRHINLKALHNIIGLQLYDYIRIPRLSNCLAEYESWCLNFGQELCLKINRTHGYFCQFCIVMLIIKFHKHSN